MQLYSWKIIASNMNLSLLIFSLFFSFFIATFFLYLTLYLCIFDKPVASAMPINSPSKSMMLFSRNFFASKPRKNLFVSQSVTLPERIYNPITAMGFSAMFTFQQDTKRQTLPAPPLP